MGRHWRSTNPPQPSLVVLCAIAGLIALALGVYLVLLGAGCNRLALARSEAAVKRAVGTCGAERLAHVQHVDLAFIPTYALFFALLARLVAGHAPWRGARAGGRLAPWVVLAAALCDVAEDVAILLALHAPVPEPLALVRDVLVHLGHGGGPWPRPWGLAKWALVDVALLLTCPVFFGTLRGGDRAGRRLGYLAGILALAAALTGLLGALVGADGLVAWSAALMAAPLALAPVFLLAWRWRRDGRPAHASLAGVRHDRAGWRQP